MKFPVKHFARYVTSAFVTLSLASNIVSAATQSNINTSFTIKKPEHPLTPVLFDIPEGNVCESFINVNGRAESNVGIYLNGNYKTVSAFSDGAFSLTLFLEDGANSFEVKAKRDNDFSNTAASSIQNDSSCLFDSAYAGSSTYKRTTDSVRLELVADHLETRKTAKYIEDNLHIIDKVIEPLDTPTNVSENTSVKRKPFNDAVKRGVAHTFDDLDDDGMSDVTEEVLGFDIYKKDSDSDGIVDSEEIIFGNTVQSELYSLNVNFDKDKDFKCDEILLNGNLSHESVEDLRDENLSLCLSGKNGEECFDIKTDKDGSFLSPLSPKLKDGTYNARFSVGDKVLYEFQASCTSARKNADVVISQVDFQKVYKDVDGRNVKKVRLFSFNPQPVVKGIGSNHDMVFGFWVQGGKRMAQSIALSDANGTFETKPHKKFKTSFGFGKASVLLQQLR